MEQQDRDILITLVADVKNLRNSQDTFHKEMKDSFTELRNNYQGITNDHEKRLQDLETMKEECKKDIGYLKEKVECKAERWVEMFIKWLVLVIGAGFLGVLGTLIYQAIIHFNGQ